MVAFMVLFRLLLPAVQVLVAAVAISGTLTVRLAAAVPLIVHILAASVVCVDARFALFEFAATGAGELLALMLPVVFALPTGTNLEFCVAFAVQLLVGVVLE